MVSPRYLVIATLTITQKNEISPTRCGAGTALETTYSSVQKYLTATDAMSREIVRKKKSKSRKHPVNLVKLLLPGQDVDEWII